MDRTLARKHLTLPKQIKKTGLLTYSLTHSLTHSMVQDILWKADNHTAKGKDKVVPVL